MADQIVKEISRNLAFQLSRKRSIHRKPFVIALVGLVGSGKSTIARTFAELTGAVVVENNKIRIALRKKKQGYKAVYAIARKIAESLLKQGTSVVLDCDAVTKKRQKSIEQYAKKYNTRVMYVRTFSDRDVMIDRLIRGRYHPDRTLFLSNTIAIREMWRRTPHHYRWSQSEGGRWILRRLPIKFFAEIDTTDPKRWKKTVRRIAKRIRKGRI